MKRAELDTELKLIHKLKSKIAMKKKLKKGTILVLKRDFPPCPIGTEFTIAYGICGRMMLKTPDFGAILPNGEKIPSMSVKIYYEYADIFENFGGWEDWFDIKPSKQVKEWSSHIIRVDGESLTKEDIERINDILK